MNNPLRVERLIMQALTLRSLFGFTLGIYLFIYPLTILTAVGEGAIDKSVAKFLFGAVFVFGILLEAIFELPLGALGDIKGYRLTLTYSFLFRTLYFIGLVLLTVLHTNGYSNGLTLLAFLTIGLFSVAYTLWSGTNSAWLYESVRRSGHSEDYENILSRVLLAHYVSLLLGALLGAWLYFADSAAWAYGIGAILSCLATFFCAKVIVDPRSPASLNPQSEQPNILIQLREVLSEAYRYCIGEKHLFLLVQLSAFFYLLVYIKDYLWPPYAKTILNITGLDYKWISIIIVMTLGRVLGNFLIGWAASKKRVRPGSVWKQLFGACDVFSVSIVVLSLLANIHVEVFWVFLMLVGFASCAVGAKEAPFDTLMNWEISSATPCDTTKKPEEVRATVLSAATIFNALVVLLFFVPTTVFGAENTVRAWFMPAGLLLLVTWWTRLKVQSTREKGTSHV